MTGGQRTARRGKAGQANKRRHQVGGGEAEAEWVVMLCLGAAGDGRPCANSITTNRHCSLLFWARVVSRHVCDILLDVPHSSYITS